MESDASSVAVGAVFQLSDGISQYPVGFYSMALTKPERNYSTYEGELIALVKAVSRFAIYLLYGDCTRRTYQAALCNLFRADLKRCSRVSRWILVLQLYRLKIELIKGNYNSVADAHSLVNSEG